MALIEVTAPALEPISLQEAKDHCRIDHVDDDSLVEPLITTARLHAEGFTKRRLITQTIDYTIDFFPAGLIRVPLAPLISVTSITYVDGDGASQILAATEYQVDALNDPPRIAEAFGKVWPVTRDELNTVTVRLVVGHGANPEDVPPPIRSAMLIMINHWYDHRNIIVVGASVAPVPMTVDALLMPWVVA